MGRFFGEGGLLRKFLALDFSALLDLGIGLDDIFAVIQAAMKLFKLPDFNVESEVRTWCKGVVALGDVIADLTTTTVDDEAVAFLDRVVTDDENWAIAWQVMQFLFAGDEDSAKVGAMELGDKTGIDPATIIAIITAILELLDWWRNRK
jgi:hypothetical protein